MSKAALQEQFTGLMSQVEQIRKKYDGRPESMTAEDEEKFDKLLDDADKVKISIERAEKEEGLTKWASSNTPGVPISGGATVTSSAEDEEKKVAAEKIAAFKTFILGGKSSLSTAEMKVLQADSPAYGGFLVAPMQFVRELIQNVMDNVWIRGMARVFPLDTAESLGAPTLDNEFNDADWTNELGTGSEDTNMTFGRRELKPVPMAKRVKISNKLLRQASLDPLSLVRERGAYKIGITEEKAFLTGSGANQPLGVFTASADGISTGRDTTAASATVIVGDDLINCKHDLKTQYWDKAVWVIHRDTLKMIRKLKDSTNNYLWATGLGPGGGLQGNPPTILDIPYRVSEYAPNTFTTGLYVAILGDFRHYWIADALDMQLQVLNELYAETNTTGYIFRRETDGMPVLEEAFRRLKLA